MSDYELDAENRRARRLEFLADEVELIQGDAWLMIRDQVEAELDA